MKTLAEIATETVEKIQAPLTPVEELKVRLEKPGMSIEGHILMHLACIVKQLEEIITHQGVRNENNKESTPKEVPKNQKSTVPKGRTQTS